MDRCRHACVRAERESSAQPDCERQAKSDIRLVFARPWPEPTANRYLRSFGPWQLTRLGAVLITPNQETKRRSMLPNLPTLGLWGYCHSVTQIEQTNSKQGILIMNVGEVSPLTKFSLSGEFSSLDPARS